jgi:hypothetical protein
VINRQNRWKWIVLGLAAIVLITLLVAPHSNPLMRGSTFSRRPDGYGAWFAYMQQQNLPVQRWQRSIDDLLTSSPAPPKTLLRVNPQLELNSVNDSDAAWVRQGNTLVVLGVLTPVSRAAFRTMQNSPQGDVKIDTTRRESATPDNTVLGDQFGAIVWQEKLGSGRLIRVTTRDLAANAYQDEPGNFAFLAQLVRQNGNAIWVDEFVHGYSDTDTSADSTSEAARSSSWIAYLAKTPLLLILIQAGVLLLVLVWTQNRRFGSPVSIAPPTVDNSEAYIQALAGVLHKAGRSEFVLETVSKAEQRLIQQALGLGTAPLDLAVVLAAWQALDRPAGDLERVLNPAQKRRMSDQDLLTWVQAIQRVRHHLP